MDRFSVLGCLMAVARLLILGYLHKKARLFIEGYLHRKARLLSWIAACFPRCLAGETKKALPEVRERCKQAQYTLGAAPGQKTKRPNTTGTRN